MNDYIKSLEQQNEELQQMLAKEQAKVIEMTQLVDLHQPRWEGSIIPVTQGCTDPREGEQFTYGGKLCTYALIVWNKSRQGYEIRWSNGLQLTPIADEAYAELKDAQQQVEDQYTTAAEMAAKYT